MQREATDLATLARGGSLSFAGSAAGALLSMGLVFVITWGLGADDGGAFFEAIALYNIVIITVTLGADTGLLRFTARFLAIDGHTGMGRLLVVALAPVIAVGVGLGIAGMVLAPSIGSWLGGTSHADAIRAMVVVMAAFVPVGALNLAVLGATRGYGTMVPTVAAERVGRPLIQLVLGAAAVVAGMSASWLAAGWVGGVAVSSVAGALWLRSLWRRLDTPVAEGAERSYAELAREFWAFSLPRAFASMFRVGVLWLDVILVGALISPRAAAIYTVATRLLQAGFLAVDAIGQAIEPMFSSLLAGNHKNRAHSLYQVATGWLVALTWPLFLAMWIFASAVLGLFGSEFADATSVVAILAGSALIGSGFGPVDVLLVMAGRSMWSFWNSATALTINVVLNLVLIPSMGLNGAALAWAVSRIAANVLPLVQVRSILGFHPFGKGWWAAAVASLATFGLGGVILHTVLGPGIGAFGIYVAIAAAAYAGLVWRWRSRLDVAAFRAIVGGRLRRRKEAPA
jgi:O-antigen/teichoic acid export membrane protein